MYRWLFKTISFLLAVTWLATNLLTPVAVLAQADPEDDETTEIGGATFSRDDFEAAINSPTPNLANTTAYVLTTISVMLVNSVSPSKLVQNPDGAAIPGSTHYASSTPRTLDNALNNGGLIGGVAFLTAELVRNPPASGSEYIAYIMHESPLIPQTAYAQGFGVGFGALSPILSTWAAFRDVAYFLLTLIFLTIGILIIFRKKVSGNVAVTVQSALPRLIITLILITFSYAIAGFIVDLMFWAIYFVVIIFSSLLNEPIDFKIASDPTLREFALDTNLFTILFQYVIAGGAGNAANALSTIVMKALTGIPFLGGDPGSWLGSILSFGLDILFTLIIGVAILIQSFRVFFQLLMSYAGFVINVVLSPFVLLQGAIPGKDPFMKWLKNLIAGLAPFVVVVFMLFMAFTLSGKNTKPGVGYDVNNPSTAGLRLPLLLTGDVSGNGIMGLLAIGFIMLLPEAVNMTKKALGASGGPLDEFKDKAVGNFKQGWEGNKYVPGAKTGLRNMAAGAGAGMAGGFVAGDKLSQDRSRPVRWAAKGAGAILGTGLGGAFGGAYTAASPPLKVINEKILKPVTPVVSRVNKEGVRVNEFIEQQRARKQLERDGERQEASTNRTSSGEPVNPSQGGGAVAP